MRVVNKIRANTQNGLLWSALGRLPCLPQKKGKGLYTIGTLIKTVLIETPSVIKSDQDAANAPESVSRVRATGICLVKSSKI